MLPQLPGNGDYLTISIFWKVALTLPTYEIQRVPSICQTDEDFGSLVKSYWKVHGVISWNSEAQFTTETKLKITNLNLQLAI